MLTYGQAPAELVGPATLLSLAHQWRLYRWDVCWHLVMMGRIEQPTEQC